MIGLTILIIVFASVAASRPSRSRGAGGADLAATTSVLPTGEPTDAGAVHWYESLTPARDAVAAAARATRAAIAAQDGNALRPACFALGSAATSARAHPAAPAAHLDALYDQGAQDYGGAAVWCSRLFDGTRAQVTTLQGEVLNSIGQGDAAWAGLARKVGVPAQASAPAPVAAASTAAPAERAGAEAAAG